MRIILAGVFALWAAGCVLPSFQKGGAVDAGGSADAAVADAGVASGPTCGLSNHLPKSCNACIRDNCCTLAKACGKGTKCGADLLKPITPITTVSTEFEPLLGCLQSKCDDACKVSWGCLGNYTWPVPAKDYTFNVSVIDYAAEPRKPLPDVTVDACQSIDPTCSSGRISHDVTDKQGVVTLTVPPAFDGFFSFAGGGYTSSVTQWNEPIYRVSNFTQYELTSDALAGLALVTGVHTSFTDPFDPKLGHLIFRVQTCLPVRYLDHAGLPYAEASDVKVTVTPNQGASTVFYIDKSGSVMLDLQATSTRGVGGVFNLPARNISVSAVDMKSGTKVAAGTVAMQAGSIAFMYMLPTSAR